MVVWFAWPATEVSVIFTKPAFLHENGNQPLLLSPSAGIGPSFLSKLGLYLLNNHCNYGLVLMVSYLCRLNI